MTESEASTGVLGDEPVPRAALWGRLRLVAILVPGGALLLATLISLTAPSIWWLDLFTHFRPQYGMALCLVAIAQLFLRPRLLSLFWLGAAVLAALSLAPLYIGRAPPTTGESLTIVHCNTGGDALDNEALVQWLKSTVPDLILLQEVTPRNLARIEAGLQDADAEYQLIAVEARDDTRGVALLSRRSGVEAEIIRLLPEHDRPMVQVSLSLSGVPMTILGFHNTRPAPSRLYRYQSEGVSAAADWCSQQAATSSQYVLIGDFNSTAQGALLTNLRRRANLNDARIGHGVCGTWPASLPAPLRVPIDGAYHSSGLVASEMRVGPRIGSDHLPIFVRLQRRLGID